MHPNHQHFLVIGTIEYADPPAFRKHAGRSPEKIVFQFVGARLFETEDLAALRIDSGHDVPDSAVLSACIHSLKNDQQSIMVRCVVKALQGAQLLNVVCQKFVILFLRLADRLADGRPLVEFDLLAGFHAVIV